MVRNRPAFTAILPRSIRSTAVAAIRTIILSPPLSVTHPFLVTCLVQKAMNPSPSNLSANILFPKMSFLSLFRRTIIRRCLLIPICVPLYRLCHLAKHNLASLKEPNTFWNGPDGFGLAATLESSRNLLVLMHRQLDGPA